MLARTTRRLFRDTRGAALVEAAIALPVVIILILGSLDLGWAVYQWNAASKATQLGARWAVVNRPVSSTLVANLTSTGWWSPTQLGLSCNDPLVTCAPFQAECRGNSTGCDVAGLLAEMRISFPQLQAGEILVRYDPIPNGDGALGFVGRPNGNPMFVTVTICRNFEFFFLAGLLDLAPANAPAGCNNPAGVPIGASYRLTTEALGFF